MKMRNRILGNLMFFAMVLFTMVILLVWGMANNIYIHEENCVVNVGDDLLYQNATTTLFEKEIEWPVTVSGEVDTNTLGEYQVHYTPLFSVNTFTKTVVVVDTEAPSIILHGESEIKVANYESYCELGYIAKDNYDGDITEKVETKITKNGNDYEIEYSVEDTSHNLTIVKRIVHVVKGTVYLTFDDGPGGDITPRILDILKEKNVKATFSL